MIAILEGYNFELIADPDDTYKMTIKISTGKVEFEEICDWLKQNCIYQP